MLRLDEVAVGELDPAKATDYADSILMFNVYDTLVLSKQGGAGVVPHLAESWETDGKTYTFKLRTDVKFQSGNPLTADDVVFSLDRMKAIGQGLSYLFANVEKAEAVDAGTVKFTLSSPYSPFISALLRLPIVDKKLVMENLGDGEGDMKDWGQAYLSTHGGGSGAYKVVSHNPQEETVMAKNADYFLGVPAKAPDTVRLRYGLEAATVRTLVAQGEHDITSQWLPPEVLKALAADGAQLLTESGGVGLLHQDEHDEEAARRRQLPPGADLCASTMRPASRWWRSPTRSRKAARRPARCRSACSARCRRPTPTSATSTRRRNISPTCKYKPEDFNLELSWVGEVPLEERFALLMQANFAEIGIKSEVKKIPWALFSEQVTKPENTPNISQVFVNAVTGDPDTLIYGMYHSSAAGTWQSPEYLKDAKVDELLDKGRTVTSDEERAAAYTEVGKRLRELAPTIFAQDQKAVFAASKRVSVPALSDPSKAFGLTGMGFTFRLMEMTE